MSPVKAARLGITPSSAKSLSFADSRSMKFLNLANASLDNLRWAKCTFRSSRAIGDSSKEYVKAYGTEYMRVYVDVVPTVSGSGVTEVTEGMLTSGVVLAVSETAN